MNTISLTISFPTCPYSSHIDGASRNLGSVGADVGAIGASQARDLQKGRAVGPLLGSFWNYFWGPNEYNIKYIYICVCLFIYVFIYVYIYICVSIYLFNIYIYLLVYLLSMYT